MKTIVAAVDTPQTSRSIFKEALVLATNLRARVVLVTVTPQYEGNMNRFLIDDAEKQFAEPFRRCLHEAVEYADSLGLELQTLHRQGKPSHEILSVAEEVNASLILLGSSKRHQVERMLSGRTLAEVIINSHCDVFLMPEEAEICFTNIVVGINGGEASKDAVNRAFDVAQSYGSQVHGICAIDLPADRSLRFDFSHDAEWKARQLLQSFSERGNELDIPVHMQVCWDSAEKSLVNYAKENNGDLIVIGSRRDLSLFEVLGGSVCEHLASIITCPMLVVKQYQADHQQTQVSAFAVEG